MRKIILVLGTIGLAGCEGMPHPIDCAMGHSYSPTWCEPGTLGYENQHNGHGRSYAQGVASVFAAAATGYAVGTQTGQAIRPHRTYYPVASGSNEAQIDGEFKGWEGDTIYKLTDGRVIQQASYHYHYHFAYSPRVVFYNDGGTKVHVIGDADDDVSVRFLQ